MLAGLAAVVAAWLKVQERKQLADATVTDIEDQLDELDPMTRAAVVARLGKDAAQGVGVIRSAT